MISPAKDLALSLVEQSWLTTRGLESQVLSYVGNTFSTSRQHCTHYTVELEGTLLSPARELIPLLVEQAWHLFSRRTT